MGEREVHLGDRYLRCFSLSVVKRLFLYCRGYGRFFFLFPLSNNWFFSSRCQTIVFLFPLSNNCFFIVEVTAVDAPVKQWLIFRLGLQWLKEAVKNLSLLPSKGPRQKTQRPLLISGSEYVKNLPKKVGQPWATFNCGSGHRRRQWRYSQPRGKCRVDWVIICGTHISDNSMQRSTIYIDLGQGRVWPPVFSLRNNLPRCWCEF